MASLKERTVARIERLRARHPHVDRLVRMQQHYGRTGASQQAGAVTYFGFLSVFPILALAFFVVGWIARVYPGALTDMISAINTMLPNLVGNGEGQISLATIQNSASAVGVVGLLGVLYAGLGWLSSLRSALIVVFRVPRREQPNFFVGKVRDLIMLVILGAVLLVAVAVTGFVGGFSSQVLHWLGLSSSLGWLVRAVTIAFGLAANMVLFFAMFVLLAEPRLERRQVWAGALLGAIGFEVLKQISSLLLHGTQGQPAFQVFGISLILLVWINYFSRVTLYAASYAAVAAPDDPPAPVQGPSTPPLRIVPATPTVNPVAAFLAGVLTTAVGAALVRGRRR